MKNVIISSFFFAFFYVLFFFLSSCKKDSEGSITGQVLYFDPVEGKNVGAGGATVAISKKSISVTATANGNYEFNSLPVGNYYIKASLKINSVYYDGEKYSSYVAANENTIVNIIITD